MPAPLTHWHPWMARAMALADRAMAGGDVPVGAVILSPTGEVLAEGWNVREADGDPTGHAECVAIRRAAAAAGDWRLTGATLVVTLEPCPMCAGLIDQVRLTRLVYGVEDPQSGAVDSRWRVLRPQVEVIAGVSREACREQLRAFFKTRRAEG
jgi:tRNA(adenine34) deaminase